MAALGLCILLNICRNNWRAAHHLIHQINLSEFLAATNEFEILGARMDLIVRRHAFRQETLTSRQYNIFALIDAGLLKVLGSLNVPLMAQLCSFLSDVRDSIADHQLTFTEESHIQATTIEQIVGQLEVAATPTSPIAIETMQQLLQLTDALLHVTCIPFLDTFLFYLFKYCFYFVLPAQR